MVLTLPILPILESLIFVSTAYLSLITDSIPIKTFVMLRDVNKAQSSLPLPIRQIEFHNVRRIHFVTM